LPEIKQDYFYSNIGIAYAKNEQFKEAKEALNTYEKLFPNTIRPFHNWAMYYALQNDKEKAIANLQKAIELGYNDIEWLTTDNSLNSIREEKEYKNLVKRLQNNQRQ